jgi:exopolysaccharide biosynthesis polyprenyl glycosylphosphotransferase
MSARTAMILFQRRLLQSGIGVRTVISCGGRGLPESVSKDLQRDIRYKFLCHAEKLDGVEKIHTTTPIDLVLHTDANPESSETSTLINFCRSHQVGYAYVPPVFAEVPHQLSISTIGLVPVLKFEPTPLDGWGRVMKRVIDLIVGFLMLVLLSPLLLLIAISILLTSGWPIFYISKRTGQYGKNVIPVLKFRSMCKDADAKKQQLTELSHRTDGPLFKIKDDPRVTKIGRILRRYSLDELPQLLNVVIGQLSLVGPRPHLPSEVEKYALHHRRVFTVRPGITGLAQISGRSNLPFEEEVQFDMRYIEDWSVFLDFWILWRTIFVVLFGRGAD